MVMTAASPDTGGDLLDLQLDDQQPKAAASPDVAKASDSGAPATTAATGLEADDFEGDDWWGEFQAAPGGGSNQPAVVDSGAATQDTTTITQPVSPEKAACDTAAASNDSAGALDYFDPLSDNPKPPEAKKAEDKDGLFSADDLNALGSATSPEKQPEGADAELIAFDEFDPLQKAKLAQAAPPLIEHDSAPAQARPGTPPPVPVQSADSVGYASVQAPAAAKPADTGYLSADAGDLLGIGGVATTVTASAGPEVNEDGAVVEDIEKKMIAVYHKGEKNMVGWYADLSKSDIKDAVLCACDAMMDGGFVLREVNMTEDGQPPDGEENNTGKVFEYEQFGELQDGGSYLLEPAQEREDLKSIAGDRWRRLRVCIDPLLHVESTTAIERMRKGSNLLKHTRYGFPHLRQFQLSDDKKRLVWYSGAKRKEDSVIQLESITEIRLGQTTPVFLNYRLPMLEHLSFSLVYGKKTLDLTCKDEFEFDHWVTGLKAIIYHFKGKQISKEQLLGHSKRFKKAVDKSNVGIKLTTLPEVKEKGHVGLDDCIEIVTHTPQQLETKLARLKERCKTMSQQVARLDHHSAAEMEVDFALLTGQGPAYASVFSQDEEAQDEEMEIRRMHQLVEQTTQVLQQARSELNALDPKNQKKEEAAAAAAAGAEGSSASSNTPAAKAKAKGKKESAACKAVDQLLWKAEVDLENVEDMYLRHIDNQKETTTPFSVSLADMNVSMANKASEVQDQITAKIQDLRGWFR
jgi:hypothetical protein